MKAIFLSYGFDFRHYARASLKRRLLRHAQTEGVATLSALQERVLRDEECMERLIVTLSIGVTSMFRDPQFYRALRRDVVPILRTYPDIRVWVAGCSSGEELYSTAIVLLEEGLQDKTQLYATDINQEVLEQAKKAIYPLGRMQEYTECYQKAGGRNSFSEYYQASHGHAALDQRLKENIVFSPHNLATDASFNEFHLILCRNVLIYFDRTLQSRVVSLFRDSLCMFGILGLGSRETLRFSKHDSAFEAIDAEAKLYRRMA